MGLHLGYEYEDNNLEQEILKEITSFKTIIECNNYIDLHTYKQWKSKNEYLYEITKLKSLFSKTYKEFNKLYEDSTSLINNHNIEIINNLYFLFINRVSENAGYFSHIEYKEWKEQSKDCINNWKENMHIIENTKYFKDITRLELLLENSDSIIRKHNDKFIKLIENSIEAVNEIKKNKYVNNKIYREWKKKYEHLFSKINTVDKNITTKADYKHIKKFIDIYKSHNIIELHNKKYINQELKKYNELFNNINGISLDKNQREAIVKDEINHLVVAGAGCGKTTLICGKVLYLVNRYNIPPEEILLISYSNKAVDEMKERLYKYNELSNIEVSTIHKFGKDIITEVDNDDPSVIDDNNMYNMVKLYFDHYMESSKKFKEKIVQFYSRYYYTLDSRGFSSEKEFLEYLKKTRKLRTIKGEVVRSFEELDIANFLYVNGIEYVYEERYKYDKKYRPDFYLPKYKIYIEHFGVDKDKKAAPFFKDPDKYVQFMKHKIEKHKHYGTKLIETYSAMKKEGILLECLEKTLKLYNVKFNKLTNEEIIKQINKALKHENLIELLCTVLSHVKSDESNYDKLKMRYDRNKKLNTYKSERENTFMEIGYFIYKTYQNELKQYSQIDFGDMINLATTYVRSRKYNNKYKYIIIDEIQDISNGTYNLINSLLNNNMSCRLFCVGDDWQSIYRFTGSNINLFYDFNKLIEDTYISYITDTYRFDEELVNISNEFIMLDKSHINKRVISNKKSTCLEQCKLTKNIINTLDEISESEDFKKTSVYILGRYKEDKSKLYRYRKYLTVDKNDNIKYSKQPNLDIKFLTVHKSKGLEADYAIILNCEESTIENKMKGFPTNIQYDTILDMVLPKSNKEEIYIYGNSEERRLFYVAMTRAKKQVYLNIPLKEEHRSIYVKDIENIKRKMSEVIVS